ncbi:DMT family transporter [Aestuariivirga sp.]|uniref:DMT family transporter n=1 Tax=Aestuariivirga sp. TaxID=2650926 RepID=UPI003784C0AC
MPDARRCCAGGEGGGRWVLPLWSRTMQTAKPLWLIAAPIIFLLLWSGGFPIAKLGIAHAEPMSFLSLRYGLVLVLLLPIAVVLRPPLPERRADWFHLAMVGFLIQTIYFGLSYIGFKAGISAGGLAIIVCLQPILVGIIAPHFAGEKVSALRWAGLALGLLGAAAVILSRSSVELEHPLGVAAGVGALLAITAGTLWEKRFGRNHHPVTSNLVQYAAGLAGTLPLALAFESFSFEWNLPFAGALAYLVIGNSIIAMSLLLAMIRAGEVSRVSSLFYLVPPIAALMAWPLLGEEMPPLGWAGFALAAAGVALARR